ncbi:hypothetical protein OE059_12190 [Exiguobacterium profundum]|uniref:Uncharacterized protein n=1 Tax=Exiguobacterium profundum TaxID=307643 RepID=A0ABY8AZJ4_9BACL|nr:hypothetical protein [Exiguobacterium profundum]WED54783.1 hypothetical protein OE059_12190 [Exiguobacterium profundum]
MASSSPGAYQPLGERQYIPLTRSLFEDDALIFEKIEYAALRHQPTGAAIVMESPSFTHFGILVSTAERRPVRLFGTLVRTCGL